MMQRKSLGPLESSCEVPIVPGWPLLRQTPDSTDSHVARLPRHLEAAESSAVGRQCAPALHRPAASSESEIMTAQYTPDLQRCRPTRRRRALAGPELTAQRARIPGAQSRVRA
jgi:hypothetical protein